MGYQKHFIPVNGSQIILETKAFVVFSLLLAAIIIF